MALNDILSKLPELNKSKTPGVDPKITDEVFGALIAGGDATMKELIAALNDVDNGSDWKVRYCLHNLGKATHGADKKAQRKVYLDGLAAGLSNDRVPAVKVFLIQQLQWFGDETVVAKLEPFLDGDNPRLFDAALRTLQAIGAAEPIRSRLTKTAHKTARILALGRMADQASAQAVRIFLADEDIEVRVAAGTALARMADAGAIDGLLKAADGAAVASLQRNRLNDACLVLAENLAEAKNNDAAKRIYTHLKTTRSDPHEHHVAYAAEQGLAG